jgi:hypothetical protein
VLRGQDPMVLDLVLFVAEAEARWLDHVHARIER